MRLKPTYLLISLGRSPQERDGVLKVLVSEEGGDGTAVHLQVLDVFGLHACESKEGNHDEGGFGMSGQRPRGWIGRRRLLPDKRLRQEMIDVSHFDATT